MILLAWQKAIPHILWGWRAPLGVSQGSWVTAIKKPAYLFINGMLFWIIIHLPVLVKSCSQFIERLNYDPWWWYDNDDGHHHHHHIIYLQVSVEISYILLCWLHCSWRHAKTCGLAFNDCSKYEWLIYQMMLQKSHPYNSLDGPLALQEVETRRVSIQSPCDGGKVVKPTPRLPLPPRRYPWYLFPLEAVSTPGP